MKQIKSSKNADRAHSYHMEGFTNGSEFAIFKEIFDQVRKDLDCGVYSELKRHNVSHYIYRYGYLYIVLNDNTVLIKGLKKGCKC